MPYYERGPASIHYEEIGSGFPLLLIPGGALTSALSSWQTASPFNPMETYKDYFRCICAGLRNALPGQSSGPLEVDRPWDAYTGDQLGLIDHLGIREFLVMGTACCSPFGRQPASLATPASLSSWRLHQHLQAHSPSVTT